MVDKTCYLCVKTHKLNKFELTYEQHTIISVETLTFFSNYNVAQLEYFEGRKNIRENHAFVNDFDTFKKVFDCYIVMILKQN